METVCSNGNTCVEFTVFLPVSVGQRKGILEHVSFLSISLNLDSMAGSTEGGGVSSNKKLNEYYTFGPKRSDNSLTLGRQNSSRECYLFPTQEVPGSNPGARWARGGLPLCSAVSP